MDVRTGGTGRGESACEVPQSTAAPDPFVECRIRINTALERLGAVGSAGLIEARAPKELAEACGFTRAMLSAVRGSRWVPLQLFSRDDLDPEAEAFRDYVKSDAEIPLANMLAETDMVRRRTAVLIDDSLVGSRAFKPIIEIARSPGYVAAPILIEGRTLGFMHADRVGQPQPVDEDDRRHIQAFTGELAIVYQRVRWGERLAERSVRVSGQLQQAAEAVRLIDSAAETFTLSLNSRSDPRSHPDGSERTHLRDASLTTREWEILVHVADGATNRAIAQRLSVSEDTVKPMYEACCANCGSPHAALPQPSIWKSAGALNERSHPGR